MGNLCCCFQKSQYCDDTHGDSERQRILDHPVGINDGDHYGSTIHGINSSGFHPNGGSGPGTGTMAVSDSMISNNNHHLNNNNRTGTGSHIDNQQTQLYQNVLDRLTSKVIDIAAIEKSNEQVDLTDREQAYRDKLMSIKKSLILPSNNLSSNNNIGDYPGKNNEPMPMDHYKQITEVAIKLNGAIEQGFKIHCDEPFVVNFDA